MRVLMLSREVSWLGGVVGFLSTFRDFVPEEVELEDFVIGQREGAGRFRRLMQPLTDAARLMSRLRRQDIDVVHINPSLNWKSFLRDGLFMLVIRLCGKAGKTLCFFHGWDVGLAERFIGNGLYRFLFANTFGASCRILVLASGFKSQCVRIGIPEEVVKVTTTMFHEGDLETVRGNEDGDGIQVLFLSRLVKEKGVFELLEAFKNVRKSFSDVRLVVAGGGPEEAAVAKAVRDWDMQEYVMLPGYVRGPDKSRLLDESDIFILPTRHGEGCPVSLLEAMASGLAVVVTPVAAIPDIVKDGRNGVIIESVDPGSIEAGLVRLLSDRKLLKQAKVNNRESAWEKYSASKVTGVLVGYYREISGSAS